MCYISNIPDVVIGYIETEQIVLCKPCKSSVYLWASAGFAKHTVKFASSYCQPIFDSDIT